MSLGAGSHAHEIRVIAASLALLRGTALADLLQAVGWRSESTFTPHYLRQLDAPSRPLALPRL